jgi:hypothetical protein
MLGWRDNETAVLESWDPANGLAHLRLYNIITKKTTILEDGPVSGAVADAGSVVHSADPVRCCLAGRPGFISWLPIKLPPPSSRGTRSIPSNGSETVPCSKWIFRVAT